MSMSMRPISTKPDLLGESPVWDGDRQRLYWIDSVSRVIRCHETASGAFREWSTPSQVGSIGLGAGETLVTGLADGIFTLDLETGAFTSVFEPEDSDPRIRF